MLGVPRLLLLWVVLLLLVDVVVVVGVTLGHILRPLAAIDTRVVDESVLAGFDKGQANRLADGKLTTISNSKLLALGNCGTFLRKKTVV